MAAHSESHPGEARTSRPSLQSQSREALPPTAYIPPEETLEIVESLTVLSERVEDGCSRTPTVDTVKRVARSLARRVAKLGGVALRESARLSTPSRGERTSLSNSLDVYRPGTDVTAPISVRPNGMELLWVCGDCGQHYPRARECPERCLACGAPKQHFYAPIED
jgi:rubrerythrin